MVWHFGGVSNTYRVHLESWVHKSKNIFIVTWLQTDNVINHVIHLSSDRNMWLYYTSLLFNFISICECNELKKCPWVNRPLSHSWRWGWVRPWDCLVRCYQARVACRAQAVGWGTGPLLYHQGWWTDTASPAAFEPAGCGTLWDSQGGTAPWLIRC